MRVWKAVGPIIITPIKHPTSLLKWELTVRSEFGDTFASFQTPIRPAVKMPKLKRTMRDQRNCEIKTRMP